MSFSVAPALRRRWLPLGGIALLLSAALLAVPACVESRPDAVPRAVSPRGPLAADELATIEIFRKASPSVVHITSLGAQRDLFSLNVQQVPRGTGTGFVWDAATHSASSASPHPANTPSRATLPSSASHIRA